MIELEDIPIEQINEFWDAHLRYLLEDGIVTDEEDIEYFASEEYRGVIRAHMLRERDRHHMIWFVRGDTRIGAAQYCTYRNEGGKCFVLDFWVFPPYRGSGTGHECFAALERQTRASGAKHYEINSEKPDSVRFWKSLGFVENGVDEYGMPLFVKK